jgi:hypothetical protein
MRKTGGQVLDDVYRLIMNGDLPGFVSGGLYKSVRPENSKLEDVVLVFKTGIDGQFQEGAITINVYVPYVDNGGMNLTPNLSRTTEIEGKLRESITPFVSSEYLFWLGNMIQTFDEVEIKHSFVSVDLKFKKATVCY